MRLVKFPHLTTKRHSAYKHTPSIRLAATCKNFPQPCKRSMQKHNRSGRPLCVKGAGAEGDWGIVKSALLLIIYEQSLRVLLRKTHLPLHKGGFRFDYALNYKL